MLKLEYCDHYFCRFCKTNLYFKDNYSLECKNSDCDYKISLNPYFMAVIERFSYKNLIVYNHLQSNKLAVKHPEIAANSYGHYFSLNIWKGMVLGDSEIFKILDVFMENFLKIRIKCKLCGADVLNLQSCDCGRYHIKIDYMFNFLRESFFLNGNRIVVDHQEKLAKYYIDNDIVDLKYDENIDNKIKNYLVLI